MILGRFLFDGTKQTPLKFISGVDENPASGLLGSHL